MQTTFWLSKNAKRKWFPQMYKSNVKWKLHFLEECSDTNKITSKNSVGSKCLTFWLQQCADFSREFKLAPFHDMSFSTTHSLVTKTVCQTHIGLQLTASTHWLVYAPKTIPVSKVLKVSCKKLKNKKNTLAFQLQLFCSTRLFAVFMTLRS